MTILFFLMAMSAVVALGFLYLFIRAVRSGQFDDDTTPAMRILLDDDVVPSDASASDTKTKEEP